jgi:hypothetical protein
MGFLFAILKPKSNGDHRATRAVAATALLVALLASGCITGRPVTERTKYWERADVMSLMNRPNRTGENPDTEVSDSIWWFY